MKNVVVKTCLAAVVCLALVACGKSQREEEYQGIKMSKQLAEKLFEFQSDPALERVSRSLYGLQLRELGDMIALGHPCPDNPSMPVTNFMNEKGEIAFTLNNVDYSDVDTFRCGLARIINMDREYAFVNTKGEMIVPFGKYTFLLPYKDGYAIAMKDGKIYVLNEKGEETKKLDFGDGVITQCGLMSLFNQYEGGQKVGLYKRNGDELLSEGSVYDWRDGKDAFIALRSQDKRWYAFDSKGNQKALDVDEVGEFEPGWEGLAPVKKNGKVGFINSKGDLVIPCEYDDAEQLSLEGGSVGFNGIAIIKNGKKGVFDDNGKEVWPIEFDGIYTCSRELISCRKGGTDGVMNRKGKWLINGTFIPIYDNLVPARGEDGLGLQTSEGKIILPCNYSGDMFSYARFNEEFGILGLSVGGEYVWFNIKTGKEVYRGHTDLVFNKSGIAVLDEYDSNGNLCYYCGAIDYTGKFIVPIKKDNRVQCCGKYIVVRDKDDKIKVYDTKGNVVWESSDECDYDYTMFLDGYYLTTKSGNTCFIDGNGNTFSIDGVLKLSDREKKDPYDEFMSNK